MILSTPTIPLDIAIIQYQPATAGQYCGLPENCYPAEPAELEFTVRTLTGHKLSESDFGAELWNELCSNVFEAAEDEYEEAKSEAAITAYEDRESNW